MAINKEGLASMLLPAIEINHFGLKSDPPQPSGVMFRISDLSRVARIDLGTSICEFIQGEEQVPEALCCIGSDCALCFEVVANKLGIALWVADKKSFEAPVFRRGSSNGQSIHHVMVCTDTFFDTTPGAVLARLRQDDPFIEASLLTVTDPRFPGLDLIKGAFTKGFRAMITYDDLILTEAFREANRNSPSTELLEWLERVRKTYQLSRNPT